MSHTAHSENRFHLINALVCKRCYRYQVLFDLSHSLTKKLNRGSGEINRIGSIIIAIQFSAMQDGDRFHNHTSKKYA